MPLGTVPLAQHTRERLAALRAERSSWMPHWRQLAEYIMPRRFRAVPSPNESRGGTISNRILDETTSIAALNLRGGMMSGITSPAKPWFALNVSGFNPQAETQAAQVWLAEVVRRMARVMAASNFYSAMSNLYLDGGVMGTAAALIYEDYENVINCVSSIAGEFFLWNDDDGSPGGLAREFTMTAGQIERRWPNGDYSSDLKTCLSSRKALLQKEFIVYHLVERRDSLTPSISPRMPWRETYWLASANEGEFLEVKGYFDKPFLAMRWDLASNDAYGRSPGMDALAGTRQLQQMTKRESQAIDKMVNPPLRADSTLKNQPATSLPGGITYIDGMTNAKPGFESLYNIRFDLQPLLSTKAALQARLKEIFFNDLFLMISQLDTVRTATEIDARREEKLTMLGPVLQRVEGDVLDPAINRIFGIMLRGGLFPPAPPELQGQPIHVDYVSPLAQAQRASSVTAIERVFATAGNLAAVTPDIMDTLDPDEGLREYGSMLAAPPRIFRDPAVVAQMREQRAQQQQQAELLQQTVAGAQGAKTLSQADVGGGQNALQAMLNGGTLQ